MREIILPHETVMLDKFASDLSLEMLYAGRGHKKELLEKYGIYEI